MLIIKFIVMNWDSVLVVVSFAVGVLFLYRRGETKLLQEILFRLVTKAEQEYGGGVGELKKAAVLELIYGKLPAILKLIISKRELGRMIEDVLTYAKKKWATNPSLYEFVYGLSPATPEDAAPMNSK